MALAAVDIRQKGREAQRWREYVFLLAATTTLMLYALINDFVTVRISPEYFVAHENLGAAGPDIQWIALGVGLKGSWWGGVILGVALLFANNPMKRWPRLPWRRMYPKLLYLFLGAAVGAALLGTGGWLEVFEKIDSNQRSAELRFVTVYWVHTGAPSSAVCQPWEAS